MRFLNALWMSFYSRHLYREVFEQWRGIGLVFIFILSLIQAIVATSQIDAQIDIFVRDYAPALVSQLPQLTIHDGLASTPEPKPYDILEPQTSKRLALINTSLEQTPKDLGDTPLFIGKTSFVLTNPGKEAQTFEFSKARNIVIEQIGVFRVLKFISDWGAILFFPILLTFQTLVFMLEVLFFSLFALISFRTSPVKATYASMLRLTAVALTPATLFSLILTVFLPPDAISSFTYVLLAVGYITYAVYVAKNPEKDLTRGD